MQIPETDILIALGLPSYINLDNDEEPEQAPESEEADDDQEETDDDQVEEPALFDYEPEMNQDL